MPNQKGKAKSKGKGKGKGKEQKEQAREPDEFDAMTYDELRDEAKKAAASLEEIRKLRNYYQLERDQVQQFYDIVHREVNETQAEMKNIESEMEMMQENHRNDVRIYMQKVIHLEFEHNNAIENIHKQAEQERENNESEYLSERAKLNHAKKLLRHQTEIEEQQYQAEIKQMQEAERKEMDKLREEFEKNHTQLQQKYDQRLEELKQDLELRRKMELHEIEERKNRHINDLMAKHEQAFTEMRNYYNSITRENLEMITSLKEDLAELRAKAAENQETIKDMARKNENLSEPLLQTQAKVKALESKLHNYEKDKVSLKISKARLLVLEDRLSTLNTQKRAIEHQYRQVETERDELYSTFESTVTAVVRKGQERNGLLEEKLRHHEGDFEAKRGMFDTLLRTGNLDNAVVAHVTQQLNEVVSAKNEQLADLKHEKTKVEKIHNDLIHIYERKLAEAGIPEEDLHLRQPMSDTIFAGDLTIE